MLPRLSRLSLCLAAVAAALALLAPIGHETVLTAVASFACLTAVGLWRVVAKEAARELLRANEAPPASVALAPSLIEATASLQRHVRDAPHPDLALHAAARVLRNELGAAQAWVHIVHDVRDDQAVLSDSIETQPGFRTAPRRLRLGDSPMAQALRSGREAGCSPGDAAVPVVCDERVVALIVLEGIGLAVDPQALGGLLEMARLTLGQSAALTSATHPGESVGGREKIAPNVLTVEDNAVQTEATAPKLRSLGCRVSTASGMLEGANMWRAAQFDLLFVDSQLAGMGAADGPPWWRRDGGVEGGAFGTPAIALSTSFLPADREHLREKGFDDHLCKPFRQSQLRDMLNRHFPQNSPGVPSGGPTHARADMPAVPPAVLDATALARLQELDPTGRNQLVERVMQAFQTSVARLRPQLEAGRRTGDHAAIKLVAHTLKSSSASIGALRLSALCADTETAVRVEAEPHLEPLLDDLNVALDGALAAIDALLKGRA